MNVPVRKPIRLHDYDYSRSGAYFVTVCTKNKQHLFWDNNDKYRPVLSDKNGLTIVGTANGRPQTSNKIRLSQYGWYVKKALHNINGIYPMVFVDKYVIMPDHIHVIIRIEVEDNIKSGGRPMAVPTISRVINQFKGYVSRQAGFHVWQSRFFDHIIRNQAEYTAYWRYIESNPVNWENDGLF